MRCRCFRSCVRSARGRRDHISSRWKSCIALWKRERSATLVRALGRLETESESSMKRGKATRYPGVFRMNDDKLMIRAKVMDPRTGLQKEVTKKLETTSLPEAARMRAE